jgi:hypothetical protein
LVYFIAIRHILWSFGAYFPILVCFTKKNLATLTPTTFVCDRCKASNESEQNGGFFRQKKVFFSSKKKFFFRHKSGFLVLELLFTGNWAHGLEC